MPPKILQPTVCMANSQSPQHLEFATHTLNFRRETSLQGSTAKTTVVERLTRIDAKTIDYRFTISDPDAYTKPWTAVMPLRLIDGLLFEYACHEANYGMEDVLRGARFREREAAKK